MSKRRTASEWNSLLRDYHRSHLTQAEFCRRRGLAVPTLCWRLRRERESASERSIRNPGDAPTLLEIQPLPASGTGWPGAATARIELNSPLGPLCVHCPCSELARILVELTAAATKPI